MIIYSKTFTQSQSFKDIEIILVDDNYFDNSIKLIEKIKKEDKRIVLKRIEELL